jgi:hypothetical protein
MNQGLAMLTGAGLGAGAMYFFDPDLGRRRRGLARDQLLHATAQIEHGLDTAWRDLRNRTQGVVAEAGAMLDGDEVSDDVLLARVRSKLGRYVSHPRSIEAAVHDGYVVLSGPVLVDEVQDLISAILSVRGVCRVENRLDVHQEAGDISGLQGDGTRGGEPLEWMQTNWSPAARLLAGIAGGALVGIGCTRRFPVACALGTLGLGLLTRAMTNQPLVASSEECCQEEQASREGRAAQSREATTSAWPSEERRGNKAPYSPLGSA